MLPRTLHSRSFLAGILAALLIAAMVWSVVRFKHQHNGGIVPGPSATDLARHPALMDWLGRHDPTVAIIGDSIVDGWHDYPDLWEKLSSLSPANLGVGADVCANVQWRIDKGELDKPSIRLVVLLIGTNDLAAGRTDEQTVASIAQCVSAIRRRAGRPKVVLMGLLPRGMKPDDPIRARIMTVNKKVAILAHGRDIVYLDIGSDLLMPDGSFADGITADSVHLVRGGYEIWVDKMLPLVTRMLTEPATNPRAILSLGDSYTIGETVTDAERWPNVLADRLGSDDVAPPTIIARTGWTTDELSTAVDRASIDGKSFDLVTLLIGVNNQFRGRTAESFRPEFVTLVQRSVKFAHGHPKQVMVVSIPDWGVMPFAEGRDRAQIGREIDAFNAVCREESQRAGATFIDITAISRDATNDASLIASDGLHPSAKQYARWVDELIAPAAREILAAIPARATASTQTSPG